MVARRPKVEISCTNCHKLFSIHQCELEKGKKRNNKYGHFCSLSCKSKYVGVRRTLKPLNEKFIESINFPENENDCWEYKHTGTGGYGRLRYRNTYIVAHQFSYELYKGKIPPGLDVCHSCDNRRCVNPAHLWLGTPLDNAHDKIMKNRSNNLIGSNHQNSKLTEKQVREIKIKLSANIPQLKIANEYKVSQTTISHIKLGTIWAHVK